MESSVRVYVNVFLSEGTCMWNPLWGYMYMESYVRVHVYGILYEDTCMWNFQ